MISPGMRAQNGCQMPSGLRDAPRQGRVDGGRGFR